MTTLPDFTASDLSSLVAARLCHDLASPLGAAANGVELLEMVAANGAHAAGSVELTLVSDSIRHANATVRFLRLAFGSAKGGKSLGASEFASILRARSAASGRHQINRNGDTPVARAEARLICLLVLCAEAAMPRGGDIRVSEAVGRWTIDATSETMDTGLNTGAPRWQRLTGVGGCNEDILPAEVEFLLAPGVAAGLGRPLTTRITDTSLTLSF